jgi:hypothetical protein
MDPRDWSGQAAEVERALSGLDFLLGDWEGSGQGHGDPIQGRLQIERVAGFVFARDQLLEDGQITHEDLAIYRWDSVNQSLRVQHYSPPGVLSDHYVLLDEERTGIRWVSGPISARIEIWMDGPELCVEVFLPGEEEPAQGMRYTRVDEA